MARGVCTEEGGMSGMTGEREALTEEVEEGGTVSRQQRFLRGDMA